MLAILLLFQSWEVPVVIGGGGLIPEQEKTKTIVGNIYIFDADFTLMRRNAASLGIMGNVLMKKSRPFENEYMLDPPGSVFLAGYGIGPSFVFNASNAWRLGAEYALYYLALDYPQTEQSVVSTVSAYHVVVGMRMFTDLMPLSFGRYSIGLKLGMQTLGFGNIYNPYNDPYNENEVFKQFSVNGYFIQLTMARR